MAKVLSVREDNNLSRYSQAELKKFIPKTILCLLAYHAVTVI